jgi:hypothetical protein
MTPSGGNRMVSLLKVLGPLEKITMLSVIALTSLLYADLARRRSIATIPFIGSSHSRSQTQLR